MKRATVLTASKSSAIADGLTYAVGDSDISPGQAVRVPLRNTLVEGIVLEVSARATQEDFDVKYIENVIDDAALLSKEHVRTLLWLSEYYCTTRRQALSLFLPPAPWSDLSPQESTGYRIDRSAPVKGAKQKLAVEHISTKGWVSLQELRNELGVSLSTLQSLEKAHILANETRREAPARFEKHVRVLRPTLTKAQEDAYALIKTSEKPSVLFGVTGSGKTEVYVSLIADSLAQGKQVIFLVPEILLTEHAMLRLERICEPEHIAILHSKLTDRARRTEWKRIHTGEVRLVIGSRSALFAPCKDLGLVIVDEEHEWTYKNEQTPRYHVRETAEELCRAFGAKLVFGSATPSLESWERAQSGRYTLARLPERYGNNSLPTVRIIDLAEVRFGKLYPFSEPLLAAIGERLSRKEQCVLFLNRRGLATALLCLDCRRRVISPESQLPFTVHERSGKLVLEDHTTGLRVPPPDFCPACKSTRLRAVGAGTERIEQIIRAQFPQARVVRADSDTVSTTEEMRNMLSVMHRREADILLGTQTVVKGLDLPHVTLSAVILADVGISLPHFRAGERIFQLMTQLAGRSGRAKPGEVLIQTFRPEAPEIRMAAEHHTEEFLNTELKMRVYAGYPPATEMIRLLYRGPNATHRAQSVYEFFEREKQQRGHMYKVSVSPTLFGGGSVWHVLLRGTDLRALLHGVELHGAVIDVDPLDCL